MEKDMKKKKLNKGLKSYRASKLLSTKEVATMFNIDETTVTKYARDGYIKCFKIGRLWRFPENEMLKVLSDQAN